MTSFFRYDKYILSSLELVVAVFFIAFGLVLVIVAMAGNRGFKCCYDEKVYSRSGRTLPFRLLV